MSAETPAAVLAVRREVDNEGNQINTAYWIWCPGCDRAHRMVKTIGDGPGWDWDGIMDAPTFSPSLLCHYPTMEDVCHSFIRAGRWEFLGDSTHALAGQTVPMVPLPDGWF